MLFGDLVGKLPTGIIVWRLEGSERLVLTFVNEAGQRMLGFDSTADVGLPVDRVFPRLAATGLTAAFIEVIRSGAGRDLGDVRYGDERVAESLWSLKAIPLRDRCVAVVFEDVSEHRRLASEARVFRDSLEQRVADRTAELDRKVQQLAHRTEEIEMFVYSVSHDLRAPLVNLQGFSKELGLGANALRAMLTAGEVPPAVQQRALSLIDTEIVESLGFIQAAVMRLSNVIDALLRLSRAGRVPHQPELVELKACAERVVASLGLTIAGMKATVVVHELGHVWGDAGALEQVIANLVGNALKYAAPGRPARVEVGRTPTGFFVRDNGRGIPPASLSKLFQVFQRFHPDVKDGDGIGLAISRRSIERHGGSIRVESEVGAGSTFFVELPSPPAT